MQSNTIGENSRTPGLPIYLDYLATTPVDRRVFDEMAPYFTAIFGNAAGRTHSFGWDAQEAVENARQEIAGLINASGAEIIFTSGANESVNLAMKGVAERYRDRGNHIITSAIEHRAVLDTCETLENQGLEVTYLPVDRGGNVDLQQLEDSITTRTIMISIMHANNETGTIFPVARIGEIAHHHDIFFLTDAARL